MTKRFLKRFERLENISKEILIKEGRKISKRFDHLEIGDKKIEIAITDRVAQEEKAPLDIRHSIICPYCGMESDANAENCSFCQHNLKTKLAADYQNKAGSLRECECGAVNRRDRAYCWICGKYLGAQEVAKTDTENIITLNIDGGTYKSNDENLPFDIKILIERIRKNGYSKKLVDEWLKERDKLKKIDGEIVTKKQEDLNYRDTRIRVLQLNIIMRAAGLIIFLIFIIFQLSTCSRYLR